MGATGYIGGRLVPRLLAEGHQVRVLVRDRTRLEARPWSCAVEILEGNVEDRDRVQAATEGIDAAYYLVHSICPDSESYQRDLESARVFTEVGGHLRQVIFLEGIPFISEEGRRLTGPEPTNGVGEILSSRLPTTEFRAGPIIGSGSAFFEMVQYLTERRPPFIAPRWIHHRVQPIAVRDVLAYLVAALGREDAMGRIDLASETLSFRQLMLQYARERGIRRFMIPAPFLAPRLSALLVGVVTPVPACLAARLLRGVIRPVRRDTARSHELFPDISPLSYRRAVELALLRASEKSVLTRWSDALGPNESFLLEDMEGMVREVRTRLVDAPPEAVFRAFTSLGGDRGWLVWNWAWRLRGIMDKLVGGPGLRRGRRDPKTLRPGDAVDFWRVEAVEFPRLLRLRAEMKLPGKAWLQWEAKAVEGQTLLTQVAIFDPHGFFGWAYWHGSYIFHARIFGGLVRGIARLALSEKGAPSQVPPGLDPRDVQEAR